MTLAVALLLLQAVAMAYKGYAHYWFVRGLSPDDAPFYFATNSEVSEIAKYAVAGFTALFASLFAWLFWRGKGWVRYVFACAALLQFIFIIGPMLCDLQRAGFDMSSIRWSLVVLGLVQPLCAVLLFLPASNRWFKARLT